MRFRSPYILLISACLLFVGTVAWGQSTGTIHGVVRDPSGSVVPNAPVTLVAVATGTSQQTKTTGAGEYTFPFLSPGVYKLTVEASGFQKYVRSDITVNVAELTVVDVTLALGATTQTVEVSGAAPLVQAETSSLGRAISNTMLGSIPLSSRNFTQALALTLTRSLVAPSKIWCNVQRKRGAR